MACCAALFPCRPTDYGRLGPASSSATMVLGPLARWLQRRVLWLCGLTQEELAASIELGCQSVSQVAATVSDGQEDLSAEQEDVELDEIDEMNLMLGSVTF